MKMKNMIATMTAVAVTAVSCVAMNASAAVTEIPYTGPSAGAMALENNGTDLRLNLLNEWTTPAIADIAGTTVVEDNITVTFTVSGIGTNSSVTNDDGSAGAAYYAYLSGSVGTTTGWEVSSAGNDPVAITGDGQYTVTWNLAEPSESISCLILSSNINLYNYGTSVEDCGVVFTLDSITTGVEDATEAPTDAPTEAPADSTTEAPADDSSKADSTTTTGGSTSSTSSSTTSKGGSTTTSNASTGDAGVAAAVAALAVAGAAVMVSKKRK